MNKRTFIGIDNGVTGSIGIIMQTNVAEHVWFILTPTHMEQNYTKKKGNITRISFQHMRQILGTFKEGGRVMMERPMVNPMRFKATVSALRALEATLCILEVLHLPLEYVDSKEWQKDLLPKGVKGTPELKKASVDIGCRLFPDHKDKIIQHKDADGLLIAHYCRNKYR